MTNCGHMECLLSKFTKSEYQDISVGGEQVMWSLTGTCSHKAWLSRHVTRYSIGIQGSKQAITGFMTLP